MSQFKHIEIVTNAAMPMHVDGEPWIQEQPSRIVVGRKKEQVVLSDVTMAMLTQL